jgi:hypothetical protein
LPEATDCPTTDRKGFGSLTKDDNEKFWFMQVAMGEKFGDSIASWRDDAN